MLQSKCFDRPTYSPPHRPAVGVSLTIATTPFHHHYHLLPPCTCIIEEDLDQELRVVEDEFYIALVKYLLVVGVSTKEWKSELVLPLDFLVCSRINFFYCVIFGAYFSLQFCGLVSISFGANLFVLQHKRYTSHGNF
jgi:hypothetical protein